MGVKILNKDVSIISSILSKPKANISSVGGIGGWAGGGGGGGFQPGDFNFNNISYNIFGDAYTNTVTFTKSGTLYIIGIQGPVAVIGSQCYINGSNELDFWSSTAMAISNAGSINTGGDGRFLYFPLYAVITVNINDTMRFYAYNEDGAYTSDNATVELRLNSFSGTLIDNFTITQTLP